MIKLPTQLLTIFQSFWGEGCRAGTPKGFSFYAKDNFKR